MSVNFWDFGFGEFVPGRSILHYSIIEVTPIGKKLRKTHSDASDYHLYFVLVVCCDSHHNFSPL